MEMNSWCGGLVLHERAEALLAREGFEVIEIVVRVRGAGFAGFRRTACPALFRAAGVPGFTKNLHRIGHRSVLAALREGIAAGLFSALGRDEATAIIAAHESWHG